MSGMSQEEPGTFTLEKTPCSDDFGGPAPAEAGSRLMAGKQDQGACMAWPVAQTPVGSPDGICLRALLHVPAPSPDMG